MGKNLVGKKKNFLTAIQAKGIIHAFPRCQPDLPCKGAVLLVALIMLITLVVLVALV